VTEAAPVRSPAAGSLAWLRRRAPATLGLLAFTVAVFAAQEASILTRGSDLVLTWGMKDRGGLQAGELWRLVTPIFIHAGVIHLAVNMYSLYVIGPAVERFFGRARLLTVYLLAGISGVVLSLALNPGPSVGASGAIFGLLGALTAFLYTHRKLFGPAAQAQLRQIGFVLALNLILSLTPGIDAWGHLGGLIAGAACGWLLGPRFAAVASDDGTTHVVDQRRWGAVRRRAAAAAVLLLAVAASVILLVR
jgi:membrane associated rhomboid family serine protease